MKGEPFKRVLRRHTSPVNSFTVLHLRGEADAKDSAIVRWQDLKLTW